MQLSVIILNYNVRYFLEQCVLSVQKALENIDGEIIVVDNNSSDDSCAMMKQRFPNVKLIENKENFGFPKGNNIGVAQAKGEYLCILNPDTVVAEDAFSKIINNEHWQLNTGIMGCKLIDGSGKFLPESKRGIPTPWVAFTKIFGLYKWFPESKLFNQYYAQHLNENQTGKTDILVGAFMMMKSDLYNEVGGFDENCFMYSDDIDLSYRVLQKGKSNYYFHETTVIHYKGESTVKDGTYMKRFQEAMNFFYKKHFNSGSFFFSLFMKIGMVFFSMVKMFQGNPKPKSKPSKYILVSDDLESESLQNSIKTALNSNNLSIQKTEESFSSNKSERIEYLLDAESISYQKIIEFMEKNASKNHSFKIVHPSSKYMIGSDNSNDKGQIIELINNS